MELIGKGKGVEASCGEVRGMEEVIGLLVWKGGGGDGREIWEKECGN